MTELMPDTPLAVLAKANSARGSLLDDVAVPSAGRADALVDGLIGTQLGNYEILFVLGKGAYGVVYKARDVKLGRFVAIKFLHEFLDARHEAMFLREAKAVAALGKHPAIVQIFEFNEYRGRNYFVLEFVGSNAAMLLRVHPKGLPIEQAARIIIDGAEGLNYAHRQEIIHRDVKPANILLEIEGGRAKLADFGVARFFDPAQGNTNDGPGGTPAYMAPEVAQGGSGDARSDLFSLGVTAYELLCGKLPFPGRTALEVMESIRHNQKIPLGKQNPKVPEALIALIERALDPDPEARFQTGDAFAAAMRGTLDGPRAGAAAMRDTTTSGQVAKAKVRAYKAAEDAKRAGAEKLANTLLAEGIAAFRDGEAYEHVRQYGPALTRYNSARAKLAEAEQAAGRILAEVRFLKTAQRNMEAARGEAERFEAPTLAAERFQAAAREEQTARQTPGLSDAALRYAKARELYVAASAKAREAGAESLTGPKAAATTARERALALEAGEYAPEETAEAEAVFKRAAEAMPDFNAARSALIEAQARFEAVIRVAEEWKRLEEERGLRPPMHVAGIEFVWIPPGSFFMGSDLGLPEEAPQHRVLIGHGYWMSKYPVTQQQWKEVMGANPSGFRGQNLPVENVSWNDCVAFAAKLAEAHGGGFRLPSEAEWEYACRAGGTGIWSFGDNAAQLDDYAWHPDNAGGRTHPVGEKHPNAWGLYDMHGNVCEWCADDWAAGYLGAPGDQFPRHTETARERVTRGGSWCVLTPECHSAWRGWHAPPDTRTDFMGFRLCRDK